VLDRGREVTATTPTHQTAVGPAPLRERTLDRAADARRDDVALQRRLVATDALALASAWTVAAVLVATSSDDAVTGWQVAGATLGGLAVLAVARLYAVRIMPLRSVEIARLGWAAAVSGLAAHVVPGPGHQPADGALLIVGVVAAFIGLVWTRGCFRIWLSGQRRQRRFQRPVLVVGSNREGTALVRLLRDHPEIGFEVRGVLADTPPAGPGDLDAPWLGSPADASAVVAATGATGVLIAATAVEPETLNRMSRSLTGEGVQVHVSAGLQGISHNRLRPMPMAHEPIYSLRSGTLAGWQQLAKRALDVAAAGTGILLAAPVLAAAAVAIKLQDGGPVFFRQERIGRNGTPFTILKLRTMVPDAERLKKDLEAANERTGPLFKLKTDPRRTRVGRVLEATSLDELPQLFNVLRGTMSLVGPRPPLASEFAQFDDELRHRQRVRPGITGLWQVEARDNPSFDAYRRLDLFYVENWSITLDLAIILATVGAVLTRWRRP
jgi:exopolysaccharide biosynthesis polyprenyl glycosylphosphotransferase